MKRCIICGNVGDENSTTCEKCGNPYVDMPADEAAAEAAAPEAAGQEQTETAKEAKPAGNGPQAARPQGAPRRRKSGPQIYGQSETPAESGQGVVRRNVQGRAPQDPNGRPVNRPNGPQGAPVNRPNGPQGAPANRPNGPQGAPANRPNGPQGAPANRPNGPQGAPAGRPNGPQGAPMNRPNGPQGAPAVRPNGPQGVPAGRPNGPQMRPSYNGMQVMETARKAIKSPLFILIALLNTVYLVSSIAAIFLEQLNFSVAARLLSGVNLPTQFVGYMDKFLVLMAKLDTDAVVVNLAMRVPDLLFCIGLWLILVTAFSAKETMSGIGFGFVKLVLIINMIKNCVVVLAGLVISVVLTVAAWVSGTGSMTVASTVTLVLMIVIAMMVIMYYFCYMATFKTVRLNASTGEPYGKVSVYVAIMEIILALTAILNLLSGIVNAEISAITGAAGKMGWMILFALWIFSYRSRMSEFEEEE